VTLEDRQIDKLLLYDGTLQLNKDKEKNLEINSNEMNIRKRIYFVNLEKHLNKKELE
jgi:hypothetical protein